MSDFVQTPNLGLYKPNYQADYGQWGNHLNSNADVLDALFPSNGSGYGSGLFLPLAGGTMTGATTFSNPAAPSNNVFLQPPSGAGETTANGSQLHSYLAFQPSTPGTYGDVFSNIRADNTVTGAPLISLWGVTSVIDYQGSGGNAGNVAFYGQTTRVTQNSGGTSNNPELWGATLEVRDVTNTDSALTNSLNGLEIDISVGNTDSANNRRALGIYLNPANGTDVLPVCDLGIHVAANQGAFNSMLRCYGNFHTAAIDLKGAVQVSGAHTIWLPDASDIAWNTAGTVRSYYDSTIFGSGGVHFNAPTQFDGAMHLTSGMQVDGGATFNGPFTLAGGLNGTAVGATTPSTGAFTTLSASGVVSGAGFSTIFAAPPAIGGTTAAAGTFVNLRANGWIFAAYNAAPAYMPPAGNYGAFAWNSSNGQGEVSYINAFGTPGVSHIFWQQTGAGAATRLMDVGTTGNVTAYGSLGIAGATGPTWTTGSAAPSATQPVGSLYSRVGGAVGGTLYVSRGGGTWAAVAGV